MTSRDVKHLLLNKVQNKIQRKLNKNEENKIVKAYNSIEPEMVSKFNTTAIINRLSDVVADNINNADNEHQRSMQRHPKQPIYQLQQPRKPAQQPNHQPRKTAQQPNHQPQLNNKPIRLDKHNIRDTSTKPTSTGVEYSDAIDNPDFDINDVFKNMLGVETDKKYVSDDGGQDIQEEEITYENIEINSVLGVNDIQTIKYLFNPSSMYEHYYVVLDTNYRATDYDNSTTINKFRWYYAETQNLRTGFTNSVGKVHDIIGVRMFQPRVHYLAAMDNTAKRISVLIEEFSHQAFIGENGRRFHFLFRPVLSAVEVSPADTQIELTTEDYNDGIFNFRKPITTIDTLTLSFGDPLVLLDFPLSPTPFERMQFAMEFTCYKSDK